MPFLIAFVLPGVILASDAELIRAELGLQASIRAAAVSGWQIPIPDFGSARLPETIEPPRLDGRLDDDLWARASEFLWTDLGDGSTRLPFSWRLRAARVGGSLYVAGERSTAQGVGPRETLRLDASWKERIFVHFVSGGRSTARYECPTSTEPVDASTFGVSFDDGAIRWELRVDRASSLWPAPVGALRPLRLSASRGHLGELFVSPPFRLIPGPLAVRVRSLRRDEIGNARIDVDVRNDSSSDVVVRRPDLTLENVAAGGSVSLGLSREVTIGAVGTTWQLRVGSIGTQFGVAVTSPDSVDFAARLSRRQALFSRVEEPIDDVLFVKRFHYRYGPFYTTYVHDMPGGNISIWSARRGSARDLVKLAGRASFRDPDLSFDGARVVFSMRPAGDTYSLYTVRTDGTDLLRVTEGGGDDLEPCFVPGGKIVFGSTRAGATNPSNRTENYCLHIVGEDGSKLERLSYNYLVDFTPTVLDDGRILFLRWVHEDKPGNFINGLWTVYPDGRELRGFFGVNRPGVAIEMRPFAKSDLIACIDVGPNGHWKSPVVGDIAVIDMRSNANDFAYRITPDRGGYKNPFPVGDGLFLAAWGWVDTGWAIYLVDRDGHRELVYRDPELSCFNPIPVRPRTEPHSIPDLSALDERAPATLFVQDVYQGLPGVERGSIDALRVVAVPDRPSGEMEPLGDQLVPVSILNRMVRRDLGTVPVHPDGSAFFEVPPNRSVFFQVLDERGFAVQTMRDTISFAAGERRACVGCHESRTLAPGDGGSTLQQALRQAPARLQGIDGEALSFPEEIQPILDRHCVRCHDAAKPAGGVALSGDLTSYFNIAYETLTRGGNNDNNQYWSRPSPAENSGQTPLVPATRYVVSALPPYATGAAASPLMRLLLEGHHNTEIDDDDLRRLARWIDLNVPYYGDWTGGRRGVSGGRRRLLSVATERLIEVTFRERCRGCHSPPDLFRGAAVNLTRPELSAVLRAPLPRALGGTGKCRKPVFISRDDTGYRAIMEAIEKDHAQVKDTGK